MKATTCNHDMKDLVLHYYGELGENESAEIDVRLTVCPSCEEYYAGLVAMESAVPRSPSVEPDETVMGAIRSATARRLREREDQKARVERTWITLPVQNRWARLSLVTVTLAVAFFAGRITLPSGPDGPSAAPAIAEISDFAFDVETGEVSVEYQTVGAGSVRGSLSDDRIQSLLEYALSSSENPGTRLRAVKMLNALEPEFFEPDQDLVNALTMIVQDDPNEGMKLQALSALRKVHVGTTLSDNLRELLMQLMDVSANSALRIEALKTLTENELARQDLNRILARAARDQNSFVRNMARMQMDNLDEPVALEQLN